MAGQRGGAGRRAPGAVNLEGLLLSQMCHTSEIEKVIKVGLGREVFENPLASAGFEVALKYYYESDPHRAPSKGVLEEAFPGIGAVLEEEVEEDTDWLIERLQRRYATNQIQTMVLDACDTMHDDPIGTMGFLQESLANAKNAAGKTGRDGPKIWDAMDLHRAEQPRWLARSRLPRAAVTLLLGDEGIGKSLFWALLITHITTGRPFEGFGMPGREPGLVVLVLTEDDWSTDVLPRLKVSGADLSMVKVFCTEEDGSGSPVFPRDISTIDAMDPKPVLVVVDCWLDTVPHGKKISDPQQAREVLHPWKEMATRTDAAVMLLGHTNRISSANPRDKYGGTYALRQKCRLTLFAQEGQDGELLIGPEKANGAAILRASIFRVDTVQFFDSTPEHDGKVPHLRYEGESDKTARQHLEANYAADKDTGGKSDALAWLAVLLGQGPRWSADVEKARKQKNIGLKAFRTAKKKLNVESEKTGDAWFMRLPSHDGRMPEGPPEFQDAPVDSSGLEGTSCSLARSGGTSFDFQNEEGTSCKEVQEKSP